MRVLVLIVAVVCASAVAGDVGSPQEAADLVLQNVLGGDYEGKVLFSFPRMVEQQELISSWHEDVRVPFDGYLVFVDDMALANWEHPCRWIFVSPDGKMHTFSMFTPPDALPRMTEEYSDLPVSYNDAPYLGVREEMLEWFEANPVDGNDPEHTYAWIVSGGYNSSNNHERYYGDVQFFYLTITQDYGYTDDKIVICFADGTNPAPDQSGGVNSNPDLDDDGDTDIDYDATYSGVQSGYNDIAGMVGPEDHLVIFTTDHGGSGKIGGNLPPEVILNLWNTESLDDDTYDGWLDNFNSASTHVCMEQCYSGGFLEETVPTTGGQPRSFTSAANGYESSWAGATYPEYDEYVYWWTGAMHGSVPPGGSYPGGALPYDPDTNGDGFVDYGEAYDFALTNDSYAQSGQEHPQYDDDPDSCGSDYYLGGLIEVSIADEGLAGLPQTGNLALLANPVSGVTLVSFEVAGSCDVELSVFDITGRRIESLVSGTIQPGSHQVGWETDGIPSGVYLVRLRAADVVESVRAVKF